MRNAIQEKVGRVVAVINEVAPSLRLRLVENMMLDATVDIVALGHETIVHYNPIDVMCFDDVELTRAILLGIEHARLHASMAALVPAPWFGPLTRGVA